MIFGAIDPKVLVLWYLDTQSTQISQKSNVYLESRKLKEKSKSDYWKD